MWLKMSSYFLSFVILKVKKKCYLTVVLDYVHVIVGVGVFDVFGVVGVVVVQIYTLY